MKRNLPIKCLGAALAVSMMLGAAACTKDSDKSSSTTSTSSAATTVTATEAAAEATTEATTEASTEDPTDKDKTSEDSTATSSSENASAAGTTFTPDEGKPSLKGDVPLQNCAINLKKQEDRYHYNMDLKMDPENNTIGGHVEFTFFNDSDADWDKLCLRDYSSLFVDAKTAGYDGAIETHGATTKIENITDGRSNEKIEMERDKDVSVVWLPLATKLAPGEKMTLSYDFEAKIPTVADRYGVQDDVYNVTNFYPILAEYTKDGWSHEKFYNCGECFFSEISDYDVKITLPKDMMLLTTGLENDETVDGDMKTQSFHAECVRDFVFCTSKYFEIITGNYKDVTIRVAYTTKEFAEPNKIFAQECLRASVDSLSAFGAAFGEYPYKDLEVILAPIDAGGMEYPNLVIITNSMSEDMAKDQTYLQSYISNMADYVVSHEIGHQWFMGIIGSNSGMQPWLDESFASYTEVVYDKTVHPDTTRYREPTAAEKAEYDEYIQKIKEKGEAPYIMFDFEPLLEEAYAEQLKNSALLPINRAYYDFATDFKYTTSIYEVGKEALYNISDAIGYNNFNAIIREYIQRNAFTNADQSDFFEVLYELAGTDNERLNFLMSVYFDENGQPA